MADRDVCDICLILVVPTAYRVFPGVIVRVMTAWDRRTMHLVRIHFFHMGRPLDIVIGVSDMVEDEEAERKRDEQKEPGHQVLSEIWGLEGHVSGQSKSMRVKGVP